MFAGAVTFIEIVATWPCTATEIDEAFTVTPEGEDVIVPTVTGPVAPPTSATVSVAVIVPALGITYVGPYCHVSNCGVGGPVTVKFVKSDIGPSCPCILVPRACTSTVPVMLEGKVIATATVT